MFLLRAKSLPPSVKSGKSTPFSCKLYGHLKQCLDVANVFCEFTVADMVRACGLSETIYVNWFCKALRIAAVTHDLGKISKGFQGQLVGNGSNHLRKPHVVRHEVASYWLMVQHSELSGAIQQVFDEEGRIGERLIPLLHAAVLGHHLKFPRSPSQELGMYDVGPVDLLLEELVDSRVNDLIEQVSGTRLTHRGDCHAPIKGTTNWLRQSVELPFRAVIDGLGLSREESNLGALLRATLIAVDTVGSILSNTAEDWMTALDFLRTSFAHESIGQGLLDIAESKRPEVRDDDISAFQARVRTASSGKVLVKAGCGSGKTIAAYEWAASHGAQGLIMAFPTTAVASQLYEDYEATTLIPSQLLHSRSAVDLELLRGSEVEESDEDETSSMNEALIRLLSPLTYCTVDTVLGILQNRRSALAMVPRIFTSRLLFDEVHLYDNRLFDHLLQFLSRFDVPALLMTATLTPDRENALRQVLGEGFEEITGPQSHELRPRYDIQVRPASLPVDSIQNMLQSNLKVLVVMNTVQEAIQAYRSIQSCVEDPSQVILLHSRYKYVDRRHRQSEVIQRFRQAEGPLCAVTTQICEVSFDVSADCLISQFAPFPSLIQRLGRLNRYARDGDGCRTAMFLEVQNPLPYDVREIRQTSRLINNLLTTGISGISQKDLSDALRRYENTAVTGSSVLAWDRLDESTKNIENLRRDGYTVEVILNGDMHRSKTNVEKIGSSLPLIKPSSAELRRLRRWRHYFLVDDSAVDYSDEGGRWKNG